jgi:hypothetical protein
VAAEATFAASKKMPDPVTTDNAAELKCVPAIITASIERDPHFFGGIRDHHRRAPPAGHG